MAQQDVQNGSSEKSVAYTALKPQLFVEAPKADEAVQFYKAAFGAVESGRTTLPKRKGDQELPHIVSAQLLLAGSTILVSDSSDESATVKAAGSAISFCLETEDVEAAVSQAVAAGAVTVGEIADGEGACGGSVGKIKDPYGIVWSICSSSKKCRADVEA